MTKGELDAVKAEKKVLRLYASRIQKGEVSQMDDLLASENACQKRVFLGIVSPTGTEEKENTRSPLLEILEYPY